MNDHHWWTAVVMDGCDRSLSKCMANIEGLSFW